MEMAEVIPLNLIHSLVQSICTRCQEVKRNDKQCKNIALRVQKLEEMSRSIKEKKRRENLNSALLKVRSVLKPADKLLKNCTNGSMVKRMVKSYDYQEEFNKLNQALSDASVTVCNALHEQLEEEKKKLAQKEAKMTQMEAEMAKMEAEMAQMKAKMAQKEVKMAQMEEEMAQKEEEMAQKGAEMAQMEAEIAQMKAEMAQMRDKMAQKEVKVALKEA
ncbi:golgin subfamily A member 6-like protein 25 [Thunnus thynnus]|uniref:golgin subfamily A member 6-like protein 25 n=1 Tax=Thunnus thynnus TaxID=8237 RepID=UPI0035272617